MTSRAEKVWKRTRVGGLLAAVLALLLWRSYFSSDGMIVWVAGVLLSLGCVLEVLRMKQLVPRSFLMPLLLGTIGGSAIGALHYAGASFGVPRIDDLIAGFPGGLAVPSSYTLAAAFALLAWALIRLPRRGPGLAREGVLILFLVLWLSAPLPALTQIWRQFGANGLVVLIVLSKIGDVFGYYVGGSIGKSHPFPGISPGKTTAGCVASLVAGALAGLACALLGLMPAGTGWLAGGLAGAVLNLAAQAGDLLESKVKRAAGVKDSGTWFGPSGGVLDLVDSLLLSVPAALLLWPVLFP